MAESPVKVHIYDLTKGMARMLSQMYLGKQLDGIWHTGIVVFGKEYFFGSYGIENCAPGAMHIGAPDRVVELGTTSLPKDVFADFLNGLAMTTFKGSKYHLLDHNCNNFSNELAQFLTGKSIPSYITDLPSEILATPMGAQIRALMDSMQASGTPVGPDPSRPPGLVRSASTVYDPEEEALLAQAQAAVDAPMPRATPRLPRSADDSDDSEGDDIFDATGVSNLEAKKPLIYTDVDITEAYASVQKALHGIVPTEDEDMLDEVFEYATTTEDALVTVSKAHFTFLSDILVSDELKTPLKINTMRMLEVVLQRSNAVNVLRFCPEHPIIEYLVLVGKQRSPDAGELTEALRMMCNACASLSGFSWLSDESEWLLEEDATLRLSNVMVVSQFCAWSLTKATTKEAQEAATKLTYNLSIPEIAEAAASVITEALLKFVAHPTNWTEGVVLPAVGALLNFVEINATATERIKASGIDWLTMGARVPKAKDLLSQLLQKVR